MLPSLLHTALPNSFLEADSYIVAANAPSQTQPQSDTYRINFNNIMLTEYVRFIAKITGSNFTFNESDLQIPVTIVSEEQETLESIFSALTQILRINGLSLLEDRGNYIISKNPLVIQIPEITSGDTFGPTETKAPLVTRVFRIHNTNVNSVAAIVHTMVSQGALISVSIETHQLIVTDITTNIDKIASLLALIDMPHSPLDIESYTAKYVATPELSSLARQILEPFIEGNPFIFVQQPETNQIFIISTPYLIERAITVLQDLDAEPKTAPLGKAVPSENIFFYKIRHLSKKDLLSALDNVITQLKSTAHPATPLITMLTSYRYIQDSNSICFIGDTGTYAKILEVLAGIDVPPNLSGTPTFFLYPIQHVSATQLLAAIKDFCAKLTASSSADPNFITALESGRYLSENNALIFSGLPDVLAKVQSTMPTLDLVPDNAGSQFLIYKLENDNLTQIENSLRDFVANLRKSTTPDLPLIDVISSLNYVSDSHSLIFTGDRTTLNRLRNVLTSLDQVEAGSRVTIYVYQPKSSSQYQLELALKQLLATLKQASVPDSALVSVVESAKFLQETQSFVFSGTQNALTRFQQILPALDAAAAKKDQQSLFIYQIHYQSPQALQDTLKALAAKLSKESGTDPDFLAAINHLEYVKETNSLMFTGTPAALDRLRQLMPTIDIASSVPASDQSTFFVYQLKAANDSQFEQSLESLVNRLKATQSPDADLISALESSHYTKETNSVIFTGSQGALAKIQQLLPSLDTLNNAQQQSSFFIYTPKKASTADFQQAINTFIANLKTAPTPDAELIQALESGKYLKETNSFTFTGSPDAVARLHELLPSLDIPPQSAKSSFQIYRIQHAKMANLKLSLDTFVKNLQAAPHPDEALIQAIQSMRFIEESNSIVFTGNQEALDHLAQLMPSFDVQWGSTAPVGLPASDHFFVYKPTYRKDGDLLKSLQEMANNLKSSGLADNALIRALDTAKWVASSNSLVFSGDTATLDNIKNLMVTVDTPTADQSLQIYLYRPINVPYEQLEQLLKNLTAKLDVGNPSDAQLKEAITTMQWVSASQSLAFKAHADTIDRIKQLITSLDIPPEGGTKQQVYFLYKLQYASIENITSYLNKIASNLGGSTIPSQGLIEVIHSIKPVPENNAVLLTGESSAVDQVKQLIAQYDTPAAAPPNSGVVFIFKPKYIDPKDLHASLETLITDLSGTSTVDAQLIATLRSARIIEANKSIAFTGTSASIEQLKLLITDLDTPDSAKQIHHVGAMTFFIYKIQYAPSSQLMASLKSVTTDLAKGGIDDKDLAQTINSMKWIKETNSLLFTGTEPTLQKVQALISKFDIPSLAPPQPLRPIEAPPSTYSIYRPQFKPGDQLIELLCEFEQNLRMGGVENLGLISTINNLKWMETTCSLIITGDQASITKVQELLKQFDVPDQKQSLINQDAQLGETSFLVYKLQYHQGDDIRTALTRVSADLQDTHKGQKLPIVDAINAVQWIPVTNSLLTSGPPDVLAKIRELILNLDVPLRQVFIEVLILQTSLSNNQSIGLSWSGRAQYKNQFSGQTGNFQPPGTDPIIGSMYAPINASTFPSVNNFVTPGGFDLGAIGDVILHNGQTFFTLGSFIQALQTDSDTAIITNPKFIAQDSNNATIFFGLNVPFTGSQIQITGAAGSSSQSLEYRNVGNNLSITPTLGSGDLITLDINTNLSSTTAAPSGVPPTTGITTSQTTITTRVQVPDGHFICLTGQLQDSKSHTRNQIPCLGGLPLIGLAFQNAARTLQKDNLMIFVKPTIMKTFDEYKQLTQNQEDLMKDTSGLPVLKEELDEGLDWVKTPDNE